MASQTTIIYLTDNALDSKIASVCQKVLLKAAEGKRIISVSQKPMEFGDNVCVGDIGRSGLSIDKQLKAGLEQVDTKFVAIAEHDCLYPGEHFNWIPPDEEYFWYNNNCWLLQYGKSNHPEYDGMFSLFRGRRVQSQLICGSDALRRAIDKKLEILTNPAVIEKWPVHHRIGEPGTNYMQRSRRVIQDDKLAGIWNKLKAYIIEFNAKDFVTKIPTVDIRHGENFTGHRRGNKRRKVLEFWGTMDTIFAE